MEVGVIFTLNDVLKTLGNERVEGGDVPYRLTENGPVPVVALADEEEEHPSDCGCEPCGIARMETVVEAEARIAMGE